MRKLIFLIIPFFIINSCGILKGNKSGNTEEGVTIPKKESLIGIKWMWKESVLTDKKVTPTKHKSFISFEKDDKLVLSSDCNKGSAFYKLKSNILEISPVMSTKMSCGSESTEKEYFKELRLAHDLFLKDNELHIALKDSIGEMIFVK